jgi:chromosome partitioning protein
MKKRVISVVNHKGGVGKTTSVVSLGVSLSQLGRRVLLVDLDPQGNLSQTLSVPKTGRTLYEALREGRDLPLVDVRPGLSVCPSSIDLVSMDLELRDRKGREYILRDLLSPLDYDYILLDCPPSLGLLTINALTASGEVFVPLTPEALPAKGLGTLLDIIQRTKEGLNPSLRLGGIIITRYQRRKINKIVEESLRESFGDLVFKTKIRENVDISESPLQGTDIFTYSPKSIGAEDYKSLSLEIESQNV